MDLEFKTIVKVEDKQIENSTYNDVKNENEQCLCNRCKKCNDYKDLCHAMLQSKVTKNKLNDEIRALRNELEEKEENIENQQIKNEILKKDCEDLSLKVCLLSQEKCNLWNEVNELKEKLKSKDLSLEYQMDQLNNCRTEISKVNQQYLLLQSEIEDSDPRPGNTSRSNNLKNSLQRGVNDYPSLYGANSEKSAVKCDDVQGYEGISNVNEVKDPSLTSRNAMASSHQNPRRANQTSPQSQEIKCPICFKIFLRPCALASHQRVHAKDWQSSRVRNDVVINNEEVLAENEFQFADVNEVSDLSSAYSTPRKAMASSHQNPRRANQTSPPSQEIKCPICFKTFLRPCALASHQRVHVKDWQSSRVKNDVVINTEEVSGSWVLQNNSQEKQLPQRSVLLHCEQCGMKFTHQKSWEDHQRLHRISDKKRVKKHFACKKCNKRFSFPQQLKEHMSQHVGEKPVFKCEICSKIFRYRGSFFEHSLIHGINKEFQCVTCKFAFTNKAHLEKHMQVHHKYE